MLLSSNGSSISCVKPRGVTVLLAGVRPDAWAMLKNLGFDRWFPPEHVFPEEYALSHLSVAG